MKLSELKIGSHVIIKKRLQQIGYSPLVWEKGDIMEIVAIDDYKEEAIIHCKVIRNTSNPKFTLPKIFKFAISKLYGDCELDSESVEFTNSTTLDVLYGR